MEDLRVPTHGEVKKLSDEELEYVIENWEKERDEALVKSKQAANMVNTLIAVRKGRIADRAESQRYANGNPNG